VDLATRRGRDRCSGRDRAPARLAVGQEGTKRTIRYLRSAFPDFAITIDDLVVAGDKVWARQHGGGTNLGSFARRPSTGVAMQIDVFDVCRFADGKMVEHWGVPDQLGAMRRLGHIPQ
jgi:predicted ester cyclase